MSQACDTCTCIVIYIKTATFHLMSVTYVRITLKTIDNAYIMKMNPPRKCNIRVGAKFSIKTWNIFNVVRVTIQVTPGYIRANSFQMI